MADAGHNRWAIAFTDTACLVTKNDTQSPVQGIFDPPMSTYRVVKALCLAGIELMK